MEKSKNGGFVKGALILGAASLIVKVIGAVFKIPLINLIDDDGQGLFNVAYQIYTFMFIIATAGFPIAISKMVAESLAKGDEADAKRVFQTAFSLLAVIGLIGSIVLYVFAESLANLVAIPDAALSIKAISPAVFFVAMASALRGYFQGRQNMVPTAVSEVIESTGKMAVGLALAAFFMGMTVNDNLGRAVDIAQGAVESLHTRKVYASAGAISGVTTGTLMSAVLLIVIYIFHAARGKNRLRRPRSLTDTLRSRSEILKGLVLIAIPITIGASVSSLTTLIDMTTISRRLVVNPEVFDKYAFMFEEGTDFAKNVISEGWTQAQINTQKASTLYGMYTGKALTMFNLPLTLVVALGMSIVPAISASLAVKDRSGAKRITGSAIRIAMLFGAPCAIGMSVLSSGVLGLLFGTDNAKTVLSILAIAIIPVSVVQVTNSILQAYGKVYYPVINMLIGGAAKVLFNYFAIPYLGIDGAPVGTFICYAIIAVLNTVQIVRLTGMRFSVGDIILKPVGAALVMGALAYLLSLVLGTSRLMTILEILICIAAYFVLVFAFRAVKREDIMAMPGGDRIAAKLERFKLIK
ncbi:MAG TPA: polysaccharide biosynthesis protein [Candidatus Monoglobus merdigallinarum]|uniref:Polysaccharide biosynthesis protein n=1 Tax=Candidatus Monoglobus merdigallinarum TaxID=2838698 RepID=A0A9D1PRY0_9FIRM|nr:polysaccharide biosynthesis protein [Candidatus Monoglobus merdigallinarum]